MLNRFEQFSSVISSIYRDIQIIERDEMEKYGFKGAYAQYLVAMNRYPEGVTASQLCDICGKDKAAVSRILSEMEGKGLITKENTEKVYKAKITLTEKGRNAAEYVCNKAKAAVEAVGNELSEVDRRVMYASLELIASKLQKLSKEGIPQNA